MNALASPGYVLTEVGVIPEDWEVATIAETMKLINGCAFKPSEWSNYGLPIIRIQNLNDASASFNCFSGLINERNRVLQGDLLFAWSGTLGSSFGARIWTGPEGVLNQHIFKVIPDQKKLTTEYAYIVFSRLEEDIAKKAHGFKSSFVHVKKSDLDSTFLPIPRIAEQRAITTVLSDMDALIRALDQLIAKKRDIKQSAMQQLLTGQQRLPGFSGDWEVVTMKSLGVTYGGLAGKNKKDFSNGNFPYIPFMNVMKGQVIDTEWLEYVSINQGELQNRVEAGDLIFNGSSETPEEVGFCSVLLEKIPNLYLNSFCFGFRLNASAKMNGLFMAYWFRSRDGRNAMSVLAQGATRYNISKSAFLKLFIPKPTYEEQSAITSILADMDNELAIIETRRDKALQIKQGMMQELLTGKIRIS